jgi:hypothetical protein
MISDALSHGELYFLDMKTYNAATSTPLPWVDVQSAPFNATYSPVMALAQNHIHFLNVPGNPIGSASIFVIHCSLTSSSCDVGMLTYFAQFRISSQNLSHTHSPSVATFRPSTVRSRRSSSQIL